MPAAACHPIVRHVNPSNVKICIAPIGVLLLCKRLLFTLKKVAFCKVKGYLWECVEY